MTGTILEKIVETKRHEVADARTARPMAEVRAAAYESPAARDFYAAVTPPHGKPRGAIRLIAEVKKASPSAGLIRADFDAVSIAEAFRSGGASALSVLTDREFFQGDLNYIELVKTPVLLPILRKDFVVDEYQIYESRAAGADAILLIAAILSPQQIIEWSRLAHELGMTSLIEVHDETELEGVMPLIDASRKTLLGINNRDLRIQRTDLDTTRRLSKCLPPGVPFVSESGIATRADARQLESIGATAMLVGESLMRAEDIKTATRALLGIGP